MKCPTCKQEASPDNPCYPFCTERCRLIDLGRWASEAYVISTPTRDAPQGPQDDDGE